MAKSETPLHAPACLEWLLACHIRLYLPLIIKIKIRNGGSGEKGADATYPGPVPAYLHPSSEIRKLAAECQTPDESHRGESCRLSLQLWFCYEPFVPRVWTSFQSLVSLWGRELLDSLFHIKYFSGSARVRGGSVVSLTFLCCLIFVLWRRKHDWDEVIVKNGFWSRNSSSVTG